MLKRKGYIKNEIGITLIALTITIIVLLILAGVTIAAISGDNGILQNAARAKEETGKANAKEQVKIAVLGSIGTDGKINIEDLNKNLENIEGLTHKGGTITDNPIDSLPAIVEVDENNLIIKEDGNVIVSEWKQDGYKITNGKTTVKVGDYVLNYDELSNGEQSKSIETAESGHTEQQTLTTEDLGWRILGIGENGDLELISDNPTIATVALDGEAGYLNEEEILNTTCNELYGKGEFAESARSLNAEDINKLANYNPETYSGYGDLYKYRFSTEAGNMQYSKSTDKGESWSDWENAESNYQTFRIPGSKETISATNPKESEEIENTTYMYSISSKIEDTDIANMIIKGTGNSNVTQWLASQAVQSNSGWCSFFTLRLNYGYLNYYDLCSSYVSSDDSSSPCIYRVRPVVTLQSNIQLEGNSEDGWIIK